MYTTGLTEQEKESLIKYLCTQGRLVIKDDGHKVFEFFNTEIDVESQFTAGHLLAKAMNNIFNQQCGVEDFES